MPQLLKGAIVGIDPFNPVASVVLFQYNSETLTRTVRAQTTGGETGTPSEPVRFKGAPIEDIKLDIEIDAADQLEKADPQAVGMGIAPQLASLEMLLYPKSAIVLANTIALAAGTIEVIEPEAPLTLFVWGPQRVLPVRLSEFTITEESYDQKLNPIRAKVSLSLRVLSYNDFPLTHPGYHLFLSHQIAKEIMASMASVSNVSSATGAKTGVA